MSAKVEENPAVESRIHKRIGQLIEALVEDERVGSSRELGRLTGIAFNTLVNWWEGKARSKVAKANPVFICYRLVNDRVDAICRRG
jgi:hypothetical protein